MCLLWVYGYVTYILCLFFLFSSDSQDSCWMFFISSPWVRSRLNFTTSSWHHPSHQTPMPPHRNISASTAMRQVFYHLLSIKNDTPSDIFKAHGDKVHGSPWMNSTLHIDILFPLSFSLSIPVSFVCPRLAIRDTKSETMQGYFKQSHISNLALL